MVYTTEQSSPMMRGLVSSSTAAGTTIGFILGSGSAWLVNALLTPDQVLTWGWRVPFVASVVLCFAGWFLRRGIHETAAGLKAAANRPALLPSLVADWLPILRTFGIVAMTNAAYYLTFTYRCRAAQEPDGCGRPDLPAREHAEPARRPAREAARRLAVGQGRPTAADARFDGGRDRDGLSGHESDAVRRAGRIHRGPNPAWRCRSGWRSGCRVRWSSRSFRCGRG